MFDVDAYVGRVGLTGRPALAELHRAHVGAIPFENLDPHRGVPMALDEESLARKMVGGGRGGYCFEQNLLFKATPARPSSRVCSSRRSVRTAPSSRSATGASSRW